MFWWYVLGLEVTRHSWGPQYSLTCQMTQKAQEEGGQQRVATERAGSAGVESKVTTGRPRQKGNRKEACNRANAGLQKPALGWFHDSPLRWFSPPGSHPEQEGRQCKLVWKIMLKWTTLETSIPDYNGKGRKGAWEVRSLFLYIFKEAINSMIKKYL